MAKATQKSSTKQDPDVAFHAMTDRHDRAWAKWGELAKQNEDDPRIAALGNECGMLEPIIIATPVHTKAGLAAKRRLIAKVGYASVNGKSEIATGDIGALVRAILAVDAGRIAAAS